MMAAVGPGNSCDRHPSQYNCGSPALGPRQSLRNLRLSYGCRDLSNLIPMIVFPREIRNDRPHIDRYTLCSALHRFHHVCFFHHPSLPIKSQPRLQKCSIFVLFTSYSPAKCKAVSFDCATTQNNHWPENENTLKKMQPQIFCLTQWAVTYDTEMMRQHVDVKRLDRSGYVTKHFGIIIN